MSEGLPGGGAGREDDRAGGRDRQRVTARDSVGQRSGERGGRGVPRWRSSPPRAQAGPLRLRAERQMGVSPE